MKWMVGVSYVNNQNLQLMRNVHDVIETPHAILEVLWFCFSNAIVRPAYFLIDLDFWSILILDIVTKNGGWYDYFNPVTFICAFPMQRAFVNVIIFHYGFCPERGLLLRISRSVVNLLYLAFV
jgi:hypothetical protein